MDATVSIERQSMKKVKVKVKTPRPRLREELKDPAFRARYEEEQQVRKMAIKIATERIK